MFSMLVFFAVANAVILLGIKKFVIDTQLYQNEQVNQTLLTFDNMEVKVLDVAAMFYALFMTISVVSTFSNIGLTSRMDDLTKVVTTENYIESTEGGLKIRINGMTFKTGGQND
jgi:uncharacterized membrane protein affecting hemolysin expression